MITQQLTELLKPEVEYFGFTLWGIEIRSQSKREMRLIVYIDKEGGISLDDCAVVSEQIEGVLEVEDSIQGSYTLEVSSPGLDRMLFNLEQYQTYIGSTVRVVCKRAIEGRKNFKGMLVSASENVIIVLIDGVEYSIDWDAIKYTYIVPQF